MYDELVKALRGCVLSMPCDSCPYYDPNGPTEKCATLNIAAADAIEELQAQLMYSNDAAKAIAEKVPKWIPVTERLPCLTTPVLATDGIEVDIAWMYGVPPRWITSFTAIDEDKLTHWMPLPKTPQPTKEE